MWRGRFVEPWKYRACRRSGARPVNVAMESENGIGGERFALKLNDLGDPVARASKTVL
jgi:hypothetical protein